MDAVTTPACPVSPVDPFADDILAAPYAFYADLRDAGPVVFLEHYGIWTCARHAEVVAVLSDWETYSSAAGVGIDDFRRTRPWRPPSLILEADPPLHTRSRTVMNRALSAKAMAALRAGFQAAAEKIADELVARRRVDGIADIAEAYPLSVFPGAIGLGAEGLENLLPYGSMAFNAFGPRNRHPLYGAILHISDDQPLRRQRFGTTTPAMAQACKHTGSAERRA